MTERKHTPYLDKPLAGRTAIVRLGQIPLKKIGRVDDIATACAFLAADSGSFITGQVLHVNGGQFMYH